MRAPAALGAAFGLVAAAASLAVLLTGGGAADTSGQPAGTSGRAADTSSAVVTYQAQVVPIVKDWGSVEVMGMRPAVADLRTGTDLGRPEIVAVQARAWRAALETDRAKLAALTPPAELRPMAALMDASMGLYLQAVQRFLDATAATGAQRGALLDQGIAAAREGADVYDRASAVLHQVRRAHGLPVTTEFPHGTGTGAP